MTKQEYEEAKQEVLKYYEKAQIMLTDEEKEDLEIVDFGLGCYRQIGLNLVTFVNTVRCCAKEMVLLPGQTCPEHIHGPVEALGYPGKEETFRCRMGTVYLNVNDKEIILQPGEQYTLYPGTRHSFRAGPEGAVISEFSTRSLDEYDIFTDPDIDRVPKIDEEETV